MQYVEGMIYQRSGFINGHLGFEDGIITEIYRGMCPGNIEPLAKGVVMPLLTNCHTHIGDAIAHGRKLTGDLESLVAPPNGLKFRILRESTPRDLRNAMHRALIDMLDTGTGTFCDFREEGLQGVELLKKAIGELPIKPMIMGRPKELKYSRSELSELLTKVNGIGVSSISDWDYSELEKVAKETKAKSKVFALHASERIREDLDMILDLKPDFLVHMTKGSNADLETLSENKIPVVICPRTNVFFKNRPNIKKMLSKNVTLVLGTDNAMLNSSNLFEELRVGFELANRTGGLSVSAEDMLIMAAVNPKKLFNATDHLNLGPGTPSNFMVLELPMDKPEYALVRGVSADKIKFITIGKSVWKK